MGKIKSMVINLRGKTIDHPIKEVFDFDQSALRL